ncbi:MAG: DUF5615 family PIN-like protein [Ignavibacteriales bacterium]|nr:DUF5615 family PIN-like protein [Ignavibacteriales bacterium]
MKILIDMNLSPCWVEVFKTHNFESIHWSNIGNPKTTDNTIMEWARNNQHIVFTHDLDFGTMLATTRVKGPSVIQIRAQNILPEQSAKKIIEVLERYESILIKGAFITVDKNKERVRILPFPEK